METAAIDRVKLGAECPACGRDYKDAEPRTTRSDPSFNVPYSRDVELQQERLDARKGMRTCRCGYVFSGEPGQPEE